MLLWVAVAGLALQILGIGIAVASVIESYHRLIGQTLRRDLWSDSLKWIRRHVLRRPQTQVIEVGGLTSESSIGRPTIVTRPHDPGEQASTPEQVKFLREYVAALSDELHRTREGAQLDLADAENRWQAKVHDLQGAIDSTDRHLSRVSDAVVGEGGRGLRWASVGLSITAMGVALTAAGLSW